MTYTQLLQGLQHSGRAPGGVATLVTQDSRKVCPGAVFVAVAGRQSDGHDFVHKALAAGAGMVVTQRPLGAAAEIVVQDTRAAYAVMCHNFFGNPQNQLTLVAVTGTNGKTTVSSVLKQTLEGCGVRCGLIGTIHSEIGPLVVPARFTTPEAWDLSALLARMVKAGCTHVVMEASSQALAQGRLYGLYFALGIFTNLTGDHLDYHGNMENYYRAKAGMAAQSKILLANADDEYGVRMMKEGGAARSVGYSAKSGPAGFGASDIQMRLDGVEFALQTAGKKFGVYFPMPGEYSVYNALAALGGALLLGCNTGQAVRALGEVAGVAGRCETLYSGHCTVITDFAHTADGLENLLCTLRPFAARRMLVLFGCAGDRDATKRPAMARAVAQYADEIFLTNDNPRTEAPAAIFEDVLPTLRKSGKLCTVEENRAKAINRALSGLQRGDMLVLCGKGHEDYQVMNGYTLYLNERDLVEAWIARHAQTK